MSVARSDIVREARRWIGTPYRHQASVLGAGCDCLGLVRGVWRAVLGPEPEAPPPYGPDWSEAGAELMHAAVSRWLAPAPTASPGDVCLFRMRPDAPMKHAAILTEPGRIVHAYWGRAVVESRMTAFWRARLAAVFSFPGVAPWPR